MKEKQKGMLYAENGALLLNDHHDAVIGHLHNRPRDPDHLNKVRGNWAQFSVI